MQEVILFYKGLDVPTRHILDSKGAIPSMKAADAKKAIQNMADHSQIWHNGTSTRCRSTETSDGLAAIQAQLNNFGREIKKVNEKVYTAQVGYELCKGPYYTKDCPLKEEGKTLEEAYYTQYGKLARYCKKRGSGNLPSSTETNPRDHVKLILTTVETDTTLIRRIGPSRYAVSGPQNSKLFFVPSQATISFPSHLYDDCCDEEEGSYKLKDLDAYSIGTTLFDNALPPKEKYPGSFTLPCIINNLCFNKALVDLGASVSVMPFSTYTKGIAENVLVGIDKFVFPVDFIVLDMSENIKTPLILGRPFLSTTHAKIVVFKRKINLRVGNDKVDFKSDIPTSNIIKRVYALSLIERIELDLEARLLRRNQVDDLEPTIEECEVVDEPMIDIVRTRCDNEIIDGLDEYPSYEHVNANFFPLLSINVMSKIFYNLIMKDKILQLWKIWILTAMKEWVISLLEDHFVEMHVSKQYGLME
ncbi:ribonuclease H-like domain, reverse transcriptase, RNA-dependent DNA polymerase [Tanacetum coccineum]